jgi:hypothetical protein
MNEQTMLERQESLLRELSQIHFMQKGTISHQRVPRSAKGTATKAMRGPYPILTWKQQGKTRSLRLRNEGEVAWAEQAVENHRRFVALCREYEELGEQLAQELRLSPNDPEMDNKLKKGLKSRLNKAARSSE